VCVLRVLLAPQSVPSCSLPTPPCRCHHHHHHPLPLTP
jgi:hypothetical protein